MHRISIEITDGKAMSRKRARTLPARHLGVQKTLQIAFVHCGFAGRDIVEFTLAHPPFQLVHQAEQMIEGIHNEQQRLVVVDLETLVDRPFQLNRVALDLGRIDRVLDLAE